MVSTFQKLFGVESNEIQKTAVLIPFYAKPLFSILKIEEFSKGLLFQVGSHPDFSLILTQKGASSAGDGILRLKETDVEHIILIGSCGLVQKTDHCDIGKIVVSEESLSLESFSQLLNGPQPELQTIHADQKLLGACRQRFTNSGIPFVRVATFASLALEEDYYDLFVKNHVDVIDMECSACFSAAQAIHRKAIALFVVTDILKELPLFSENHPGYEKIFNDASKTLAKSLSEIIEALNSNG